MKRALSVLALTLPITAFSAWIDGKGKPIPDTPSMRSSGDFGAQLLLTSSEPEFRKAWNATTGTPTLQTSNKVRHGQSIAGVILFSGCLPNASKACDVSVAFTVLNPDGSTTPAGGGPVWSHSPPKPGIIMMGEASINMGFGKDDAPGAYTLNATVTDKVGHRTLKLSLPFSVAR